MLACLSDTKIYAQAPLKNANSTERDTRYISSPTLSMALLDVRQKQFILAVILLESAGGEITEDLKVSVPGLKLFYFVHRSAKKFY